jgi:hypothetical protein
LSKNKKEEIKVELIYPIQQKLSANPSDEYWQYKVDVKNNYSEVMPGYESKPTITVSVIYSEKKKEFMPSCYSGAAVKKIEASSKPKPSATPKPIKTAIPFKDLPVLGLTTKY